MNWNTIAIERGPGAGTQYSVPDIDTLEQLLALAPDTEREAYLADLVSDEVKRIGRFLRDLESAESDAAKKAGESWSPWTPAMRELKLATYWTNEARKASSGVAALRNAVRKFAGIRDTVMAEFAIATATGDTSAIIALAPRVASSNADYQSAVAALEKKNAELREKRAAEEASEKATA